MRLLAFLLLLCASHALAQYISKGQFECMLPNHNNTDEWVHDLNQVFSKYDITTPKRIVAFITQAIVQTDNITRMVEYTSIPNDTYPYGWNPWCPEYDGGCKFKGRGILQIHGLLNYQAAARHANILFEKFPEQMAKRPYAFDESGYFWYKHGLNELAEQGDWSLMTAQLTVGQPPNLPSRLRCKERVSKCYRPITSISSHCGFTYTCSGDDTIDTITTRYRMLNSEVLAANNIPTDFYACPPGTKLFIPKC